MHAAEQVINALSEASRQDTFLSQQPEAFRNMRTRQDLVHQDAEREHVKGGADRRVCQRLWRRVRQRVVAGPRLVCLAPAAKLGELELLLLAARCNRPHEVGTTVSYWTQSRPRARVNELVQLLLAERAEKLLSAVNHAT